MKISNKTYYRHKIYINSMSDYDFKSFFKFAHKNHIYFDKSLPFWKMLKRKFNV